MDVLLSAVCVTNLEVPQPALVARLRIGRVGLSVAELARLAQLRPRSLSRSVSPTVQKGLVPIARILAEVEEMTANPNQAIVWFRHQPIPAFGGMTAQELVCAGHADAVFVFLDHLRDGGYA